MFDGTISWFSSVTISSGESSIVIGYKDTISGGSSIMQPIKQPENMRNTWRPSDDPHHITLIYKIYKIFYHFENMISIYNNMKWNAYV